MMFRARRPHAWLGALVLPAIAVANEHASWSADPTKAACLSASAEWADLREDHQLRAARDKLFVCASASCPTDIREECSRHIPELTAAIPSVVFAARDPAGNDLAVVTVTMDGKPLATKLDGSAIAIDPGEHTFRFEAAGQAPVDKKFVIEEGEARRHERIQFGSSSSPERLAPVGSEPAPHAAPAVSAQSSPLATGETTSTAGAVHGSGLGTMKILGLSAGGLGLAGIAVGSVLGLASNSKWQAAKRDCGTGCAPNSTAQSERTEAYSEAGASTVAFVVGGALLATGCTLFLIAPNGASTETAALRVSPSVGPGVAGMILRGAF